MAIVKPKNEFQFSMWALMVTITVACVILAFPGGFFLLTIGTVWVLLLAGIFGILLVLQVPIYRFLAGSNMMEKVESAGEPADTQFI